MNTDKLKEMMNSPSKLFGVLFQMRDTAHLAHLSTKSFAEHSALNSFYDELLDKIDALIESYQGEYGIQSITIPGSSTPSNMISYLEEQCTLINKYYSSFKESYLQNQLDTIMELIYSTIYKLKNLK